MTYKLTSGMRKEEIPVAVLFDRHVSCFESVVEYLKENKQLSYKQIALLTNRDERTIWTVYNRAKKKRNGEIPSYKIKKHPVAVPISIFADREVSVLETISEYLKDSLNLNYHEIAELTNRDDRTIWTSYNRAKNKREDESNASAPVVVS